MVEKYVKLSDVKKKLNYIYRAHGTAPQMRQSISDALAKIPYTVKEELEATLEAEPVKLGKWVDDGIVICSECGKRSIEDFETPYCQWCGAKMEV